MDEVNIRDGASISGNIVNEWKQFNKDGKGTFDGKDGNDYMRKLAIQYAKNGVAGYYYDKYIPDLVTAVNFYGDHEYDGDIEGADNTKLNVKSGTLVYGGSSDTVNVTVEKGAALYGGEFTVNDMTESMASGFSDETTGQFINYGTIGASGADTVQSINGKLVSDGTLRGYGGGAGGYIEVTGKAEVESSTATVTGALPGETTQVLTASEGISGTLANAGEEKAVEVSAMLDAYGTQDESTISVTAVAADNLGEKSAWQQDAYSGVSSLTAAGGYDGGTEKELRELYSLSAGEAKEVLDSLGEEGREADASAASAQARSPIGRIVGGHVRDFYTIVPGELRLPVSKLADGEVKSLTLPIKVPVATENSGWVKFGKAWGDLSGSDNYHSSNVTGGYDWQKGASGRQGVFLSYGQSALGGNTSSERLYDTRLGYYATDLAADGANEYYWYADAGTLQGKTRRARQLPHLSPSFMDGKYHGYILELGGEWKHDLHFADGRTWHVSPYLGGTVSFMHRGGYTEHGSLAALRMDDHDNFYAALDAGLEMKRYFTKGSYSLRAGVRQALCGADEDQTAYSTIVDGKRFTLESHEDKTHLVLSLSGDTELARSLRLGGDLFYQKGAHDREVSAQLMLRKLW